MRRRFIAIGTPAARVSVTGNIKYDWQPPGKEPQEVTTVKSRLFSPPAFWFLAASTHEGEEEAVMEVVRELLPSYSGFRVLIAPRHMNRLPAIEAAARSRGIVLKKVFEDVKNDYDVKEAKNVWLLDRMGVLAYFYPAMDAVFVGGSLVPVGGHNIVEPAYFGKPVLFGPRTENFAEMAALFCERRAAIRVKDAADLKQQVLRLIRRPEERAAMGDRARRLVDERGGALQRNTDAFLTTPTDRVKQ